MLSCKTPKILGSSAATLTSATAVAETVSDNDDLLLEILLRLPIRSLLKFKSVSKRWLSIISNPRFSYLRSTSHPLTPSGIFLRRPCPKYPMFDFVNLRVNPSRAPFESLGFTEQKHGIVILQSCNGLLLCSSNNGNYSERDYYIHNPTTNQFTTLPKLQKKDGEHVRTIIYGLNLAFDPSRSSNYKVVCVRNSNSFTDNYQIEIYSPDTGPWRPCQGLFAAPFNMRFDCGVYWNGAVHWISTWENCLYFDLREEKLHELPMPQVPDGWEERRVEYFGECGGRLHLIEIYEPQDLQFNVYEMQDDHSGWFVKYHIDLHCVSTAYPEMISSEDDMGFSKFSILAMIDQSEVDEESYLVLQVLGKVVGVNVKSRSFESLFDVINDGGISEAIEAIGFGQIDAYLYIESLACV